MQCWCEHRSFCNTCTVCPSKINTDPVKPGELSGKPLKNLIWPQLLYLTLLTHTYLIYSLAKYDLRRPLCQPLHLQNYNFQAMLKVKRCQNMMGIIWILLNDCTSQARNWTTLLNRPKNMGHICLPQKFSFQHLESFNQN